MNKAKLKTYAPQARKDFIAAVTARAHRLGLAESNGQLQIAPAEKNGELVIIAGQSWPAMISRQRDNLIRLIQKHGFAQTIENVAYTWFNRFAALRYMEIHDYLTHGYRVLSNRAGGLPEILGAAPELAQHGDLPGLKPERAIELKLAGDQDGELYRMTLIAQCNALSNAMPFLFEKIDDETELLLPDNLLLTDSVVAKLVEAIPEEDWSQVEIIGWLYQFYISEKKDQVIGKVVKSEDIPAATQLFTPNWIVQYLVQNSIGRLWLMANPGSTLKSQWPYYIEPAEQTPEVQAQLDALIQARMAEDGGSLNPESLTVLDPACGSGHILVEAYELLKAIYLERGYQPRSIPRLILEKNLFGLDIDDRAAQLAGFALLMKARADDRRLLDNPPTLNVLALQENKGLDADELAQALSGYAALTRPTITSLLETFAHAKTFGSLIQIPVELKVQLPDIEEDLQQAIQSGDLLAQVAALELLALVRQARILGMQFDAVVANPPYMGSKGMNAVLKDYAKRAFPDSKSDLFAMFIERGFAWCKPMGYNSMVTMQSWMFLSSFETMREKLLKERTLSCMVHMGNGVMGIAFGTAATTFLNQHVNDYASSFSYCDNDNLTEQDIPEQFPVQNARLKTAKPDDFKKISGSPIAYWVSAALRKAFETKISFEQFGTPRQGLGTGNNARFTRYWFEVSIQKIYFNSKNCEEALQSGRKWFPYTKGGGFRKWYGNELDIVNWENDGVEIRDALKGMNPNIPRSEEHYFKPGITWGLITSAEFSARYSKQGAIFDVGGSKAMPSRENTFPALGLLNSKISAAFLRTLNPTLNFQVGDIKRIPIINFSKIASVSSVVEQAVNIAKNDWNGSETSWDFSNNLLINNKQKLLETSYLKWEKQNCEAIAKMRCLEEENNSLFIEAYGLQEELSPEVPEEQITLVRADKEKDCQRLISYAIGCMMGRYSLDEPGLIYAHAGNVGFDPTRYSTFPADADGIVPITDELWFEDDAANRIREFLLAVWGTESLEENLAWLAESLGQKANETPQETIRRYLAGSFFKDHLQTYKKRPIYWLFSSGKQGAFQALVYLHRYHEGTLARMRAEYVVPLTGKIQSRIEMLEKDAAAAPSNAARNKLSKDIEKLKKKHVELLAYDEKLRHYADLRIQLDLDDGVKVNYGKFGDLLAEVKSVTGGTSDD
jgi:SAM-dependent methyltransferase